MKLLIKAIRNRLIADSTLTAEVAGVDIHTTHNLESANYPCISMGIVTSREMPGIDGLTYCEVDLRVYVQATDLGMKQTAWEIYALVKGLLHNQEQDISTSDRKIHAIYEIDASANSFDNRADSWVIRARYGIIFGTSSVVAFTAANGAIYADTTDVQAQVSHEVGKYKGRFSVEISFEREVETEQERFGKDAFYYSGTVMIRIEEVVFDPEALNTLWSITKNASDTLSDDSTACTSYTITQSSVPQSVQFLFRCTRTDDGKVVEVRANDTMCESMTIPFEKRELALSNCVFYCLSDGSGNIVKVSVEN